LSMVGKIQKKFEEKTNLLQMKKGILNMTRAQKTRTGVEKQEVKRKKELSNRA